LNAEKLSRDCYKIAFL